MGKIFSIVFFAIILLSFVSAHAQTIIWVSEWNQDANGIPYDQGWIDILEFQGYDVIAEVNDTYEVLNTAKMNALDAADLIIFSRNTNSASYIDGGEISQWNSIDTPMILLNPYLARRNRWQWINDRTVDEFASKQSMEIVESSHDLFDGITSDGDEVDMFDEYVNDGEVSFITSSTVGNGKLLARRSISGYAWIAEWDAGTQYYLGTSQKPYEKRMLFTAGGSNSQESGSFNLTETGKQIFLNAVGYMLGAANLAKVHYPANNAKDIEYQLSLSWTPGISTLTHNVFLGTDFYDVVNATVDNPLGTIVSEGLPLDVNVFDTGILEFETTYYWRVDQVDYSSEDIIYKGPVWSFTTEPLSLDISYDSITAKALNSLSNNDPNDTINGNGLDPSNPDEHFVSSGLWAGSFPDNNEANGLWIQYDFDKVYELHEMLVWNYNQSLNWRFGFKEVLVEYSEDGNTWKVLPGVNEFERASGQSGYVYNTIVPLDIAARSIRITALSNWGGKYYGLSEIRFTYIPVRARKPSPQDGATNISVDTILSWRKGRDSTGHLIYLSTDKASVENGTDSCESINDSCYVTSLNLGCTYYWRVDEINNDVSHPVWKGDIWNFSTMEFAPIDDFENYDNTDSNAVWVKWTDGFNDPVNGSQIGHDPPSYNEYEIVQQGLQSAVIYYNNNDSGNEQADNSEVEREFDTPQDWTIKGADTLRLYYRGRASKFNNPSEGVFAFSAEGEDIWNTTDEFRYVYKQLNGDGSIIARVDSLEYAHEWSKAGVMIRNTLDANSIHAMTILNAAGTGSFQRRSSKGATTFRTDKLNLGFPYWVKISRQGNTLSAQRSNDGINWVSFQFDPGKPSSVTIEMPDKLNYNIYIGLVVTSHVDNVLAGATFSGVETTGNVSDKWNVIEIGDEYQEDGLNDIDNLYVALEDNTGERQRVYASQMAVVTPVWNEWLIPYTDFTGVNLSEIKKLAIGIGDEAYPLNGTGMIYIDNIAFGHPIKSE